MMNWSRKIEKKTHALMTVCCFAAAVNMAEGKTVAYFPLEQDPETGGKQLFSLVNPSDVLTTSFTTTLTGAEPAVAGVSRALTGRLADTPLNRTSIAAWTGNAGFQNPSLGDYLRYDRNWTVECWFKLKEAPTGTVYLFGNWDGSTKGWFLSLNSAGQFVLSARESGSWLRQDVVLSTLNFGTLFLDWAHVALSYQCDAGGEKNGTFVCYINGSTVSRQTGVAWTGLSDGTPHAFYVGGMPARPTMVAAMKMDMLRISDTALSVSDMMTKSSFESKECGSTLGYWKLDYGTANVAKTEYVVTASSLVSEPWSDERAVASIPCPDVADKVSSDIRTDYGSLSFKGSGGSKYVKFSSGLVDYLALDKDYTAEFWLRHDSVDLSTSSWQILYSVNGAGNNRCTLAVRIKNGGWFYFMYVAALDATIYVADDTQFKKAGVNAVAPLADGKWHHHALVYDADNGNGTFTLYRDGEALGSIQLVRQRPNGGVGPVLTAGSIAPLLGGRDAGSAGLVDAYVDEFRISSKALETSEFLNGTFSRPSAVEGVTRDYYAIDYVNGVLMLSNAVNVVAPLVASGESVSGSTSCGRKLIANPDDSEDFIGDRINDKGSASIKGNGGLVSYAAGTIDCSMCFTIEGWLKWDGSGNVPQSIANAFDGSYGWKLEVCAANNLKLTIGDGVQEKLLEKEFLLPESMVKTWHHVAVRHNPDYYGLSGSWEVFWDGALLGSVEQTSVYPTVVQRMASQLKIGSDGATAFNGKMDLWRITDGIRSADEFMYGPVDGHGLIMLFR